MSPVVSEQQTPAPPSGKLAPEEEPRVVVETNDAEIPAIRASGLSRKFGVFGRAKWVVQDLSFEVPQGSVTALLGRNGIGKSTTINMLLGLLPPTSGEVQILGKDPRKLGTSLFAEVGYVSEKRELLDDQKVAGLTKIVAEIHGERFDPERFEDLRRRFELDPKARCKTLSKGQRARLLLALTIAANPRVLVLDEPTSGLDVLVRDDFLSGIAEFAAEEGRAVLLSTHLIEDVARICDQSVIMREGRPALVGETEDLRASVQRYLVRLKVTVEGRLELPLPDGAVVLERDPRALTIVSSGAPEHLEAALDQALPLAGIERQPASMKEAFACLSAPLRGGAA